MLDTTEGIIGAYRLKVWKWIWDEIAEPQHVTDEEWDGFI